MARIIFDVDPEKHKQYVAAFIYILKQEGYIKVPMKYRMFHKYQDSSWIKTTRTDDYLETAIRRAAGCSEDAIIWGMTAVVEADTNHKLHIVEFPAGGGRPSWIRSGYESQVLAALGLQQSKIDVQNQSCPDCTDGFYYPLIGPKELCKTCHKS